MASGYLIAKSKQVMLSGEGGLLYQRALCAKALQPRALAAMGPDYSLGVVVPLAVLTHFTPV